MMDKKTYTSVNMFLRVHVPYSVSSSNELLEVEGYIAKYQ